MAWEAGIIVSATPVGPKTTAGTLSARINALVGGSGVENWSFVEQVPAGTGAGQSGSATQAVDVYKCSGSGTSANSAGVDFYIGVGYNTTTGVWTYFQVAEDYLSIAANPANADRGKIRRMCPLPVTGVTPDVTNFTYTETYTTFTAATKPDFSPTLNNTGFSYWLKLDHNFIILTVKVGTTVTTLYAGLMDTLTNVTDTMPLVYCVGGNASFSRLPGVAANAGGAAMWGATMMPWSNPTLLGQATILQLDLWAGTSKFWVSRIAAAHDVSFANMATYGGLRGLLKGEVLAVSVAGTVAPGDTISIGGNTWTCISTATWTGATGLANVYVTNAGQYLFVRAN